jgi:hypothetical protein
MEQENNIELRSEEVQEILGSPPNWIIRSAITIISLIVFYPADWLLFLQIP